MTLADRIELAAFEHRFNNALGVRASVLVAGNKKHAHGEVVRSVGVLPAGNS